MPIEMISAGEAARRLGITPRTVRRWLREGRLNGRKVGERGHWRVEWDSSIAGRAIMSPVNAYIKKSCVRHGGTKVSQIKWAGRGSVGKELKIVVHGMTREDCINGVRRISGGMTLDEINSMGSCTQCDGYSWQDDITLDKRRAVHGIRENLNRSNEEESVRVLKEILELLNRENAAQRYITTPYEYGTPTVPAERLTFTDSLGSGDVTYTNNTADTVEASLGISGQVGSFHGIPVFASSLIPDNDRVPFVPDASGSTVVNIQTQGIFFMPLAVHGLEIGTTMSAERIANRISEDHGDDEGIFLQVITLPDSPGRDPREGEEGAFRVMGINEAPETVPGLFTFTGGTLTIDGNIGETTMTRNTLVRDDSETPSFEQVIQEARDDMSVEGRDGLLRTSSEYTRAIAEIVTARPMGLSMRAYIDAIQGGFVHAREISEEMYNDTIAANASRRLNNENEFYLAVAEVPGSGPAFRNLIGSTIGMNMEIRGLIRDRALFITNIETTPGQGEGVLGRYRVPTSDDGGNMIGNRRG